MKLSSLPLLFLLLFSMHGFSQSNVELMRNIGKKNFITIGYLLPQGNTKSDFTGANSASQMLSFLNGQYMGGLGAKYGLNASFGDAQINVHIDPQYKISIDWNLFDAEYTVFDWSANTFVHKGDVNGEVIKELKSIKGGTRIGPAVTFKLSKNIAAGVYYAARPGVQFLLDDMAYRTNATTINTISSEKFNFNFSSEVGLKFHFFNSITINPFYHFGKFNWKNKITSTVTSSTTEQTVNANYPFSFLGIRLGFL